ncbi:MAG: LacI family DNA-binding transcriptional regulator, partial [Chloroflexota bacterium]
VMVTLHDVAKAAGVTPSAVSYALSGKGTLSAATRSRILAYARELGYRPNLVARGLATQQTHTIGLVVGDIANPFYGVAAQVVERTAYRTGYRAFFVSTDRDDQLGGELLADLAARRVDGILAMAGGLPAEMVRSLVAKGVPVVWCMWEDEGQDLKPSVDLDYFAGGRSVADHLIALGHRRIAIVAHKPNPGATVHEHRLRVAGFRAGLAAAGSRDEPLMAFGDSTVESGMAAGHALLSLSTPPTAIFATNDLMALGVLGAARDLGVPVPDALSIVGFDDIMAAALTGPPLTTVHVDVSAIMAHATTLLLRMIAGSAPGEPLMLSPTLVIRGSTGSARQDADDPTSLASPPLNHPSPAGRS